jgi:hypothetical protein
MPVQVLDYNQGGGILLTRLDRNFSVFLGVSDHENVFPLTITKFLISHVPTGSYSVVRIPWNDIRTYGPYLSIHLLDSEKIEAGGLAPTELEDLMFGLPEDFDQWYKGEGVMGGYSFGIVGLFSGGWDGDGGNPFSEWGGQYIKSPLILNSDWVSFGFAQ